MTSQLQSSEGSGHTAVETESEAGSPDADIELPNPEDFSSSGDFKKAVYDQIEDGVPSLMMDLKLEITWRKANDVELEDYMKEVLKDE